MSRAVELFKTLPFAARLSSIVVMVVLICGVLNPLISYNPVDDAHLELRFQSPSSVYWFGTDGQGRSVGMRMFKAVEAFFFPGLIAGVIAVFWGGILGAICGYFGGWLGRVISALLELIDTIPRMVFLVLICTIFPPSITLIASVSAVLFIPSIATTIRRKVEALGAEDCILAYVAHGFHPLKIICYHILWLQCRGQLTRQLIFVFAYVLFIETALSYLGDYGVQEPDPSWGNMVAQTREAITPWPWILPTIAIIITIASLLAFANGLAARDEEVKR
jgi:peptide/nickel transport system permease protein